MAKDLKGKELPEGIIQRPDGRYMARFRYDGERYTLYNKDLKKLIRDMNDKRYEAEHGICVTETRISVNDWFEIWMREYKLNSVKYGTYQIYEQTYKLYIKPRIGKKRLSTVRTDQIQRIYNELNADGYTYKMSFSKLFGGVFVSLFGGKFRF